MEMGGKSGKKIEKGKSRNKISSWKLKRFKSDEKKIYFVISLPRLKKMPEFMTFKVLSLPTTFWAI